MFKNPLCFPIVFRTSSLSHTRVLSYLNYTNICFLRDFIFLITQMFLYKFVYFLVSHLRKTPSMSTTKIRETISFELDDKLYYALLCCTRNFTVMRDVIATFFQFLSHPFNIEGALMNPL